MRTVEQQFCSKNCTIVLKWYNKDSALGTTKRTIKNLLWISRGEQFFWLKSVVSTLLKFLHLTFEYHVCVDQKGTHIEPVEPRLTELQLTDQYSCGRAVFTQTWILWRKGYILSLQCFCKIYSKTGSCKARGYFNVFQLMSTWVLNKR